MPFCDLSGSRGINVYYEFHGPRKEEFKGNQEEILFVLPGSNADLRRQTDQMYIRMTEGFFRILIFDHRNTGQTTVKDEPCTMEDYGDDAAALLEALVPARPVFVLGMSFGGMVAQHLALRHPHLVRKLVLSCCSSGGPGGSSFPVHEWYAAGFSVQDRANAKATTANTSRTEEWKKANKSEWGMILALMTRDENIGKDEPLYDVGIERQLDARKLHNTWGYLDKLNMDVLLVGSPLDGICPVEIMKNMAMKIGENCSTKLDFGWGHALVAADVESMPFINDWLRGHTVATQSSSIRWEVIGGSAKGGIIVRQGVDLKSPQLAERLSTGAVVEEIEIAGERLHYKKLTGDGPSQGWVSITFSGKGLLVKI